MGTTASDADAVKGLAEKIKQVNDNLEMVSLRVKGDRFYVRGSQFPIKPGAESVSRHEIPTGYRANLNGLRMAKAIASEIDSKLIRHVFDWTPYLKGKAKPAETVDQWVNRLIADHWTRTQRNKNKENTFNKSYLRIYRSLPADAPLSMSLLLETMCQRTEPESRNRQAYSIAFSRLADFAQIKGADELRELGKGYTSNSVDPKDLPSDEKILEIYHGIKNTDWKWVFGVLAIYGLRNHESFFLDLSGVSSELGTVRVLEGKTGGRIAYPCFGENWDIDISVRSLPKLNWQEYSHNKIGAKISHRFAAMKLGVTPYSLRHCFARRMFEQGYSSRLAAKSMGHSVQIHEKVYSAWWSQDAYDRVFKETRDKRKS